MNGGDTPEDRVVQIEDLPDADSSSHVRLAILFPAWLTSPQSPRQRRQRLAAFIALGCMALLIILGRHPGGAQPGREGHRSPHSHPNTTTRR